VPLPPTPPPSSSPSEALAAALGDARPEGSAAPAVATPTPAPIVATPAEPPNTPPAPTPPPATAAPQPATPAPSPTCSAAGPPLLTDTGNQVDFSNGNVVSFQAGQPDFLVVHVAGTVLRLEITNATDVQGDVDSATVVNGQGRRARDGTITAQLVEVVCPGVTGVNLTP